VPSPQPQSSTQSADEQYLPYLWVLCAAVSIAFLVVAARLAFVVTADVGDVIPVLIAAASFGLLAVGMRASDQSR
jgi:hypothetical protein